MDTQLINTIVTVIGGLLMTALTVFGPLYLHRITKRAGIQLSREEETHLLESARVGVRWVEERARAEMTRMSSEEKHKAAARATRTMAKGAIANLTPERIDRAVLVAVYEERNEMLPDLNAEDILEEDP